MTKEKRFSSLLTCGHCGNSAPMEIVASYSDKTTHDDPADDRHAPWDTAQVYQMLKCPACGAITFQNYFWHDWMESEADLTVKTLYPSETRLPLGLPSAIKTALLAANRVRAIDANAFGVLIGRVLAMLCADRNATGKFLSHNLADLAFKGEIPKKLVDVATSLNAFRNVGAHPELGELTIEEVPILEDLCKAILDYVYTAPYLVQKAQDALNKLKARPAVMEPPKASAA